MESDSEGNPFYDWIESNQEDNEYLFNGQNIVYIPNKAAVKAVLSRSGITLKDFKSAKKFPGQYGNVQRAYLDFWSDPFGFKVFQVRKPGNSASTITVEFPFGSYKVTSQESYYDIRVKFIAGWVSTPALGKYLTRILKGNSENDQNPFNEFETSKASRFGSTQYLPDISYLPELYKKLGVKDFTDLHISGTGDWEKAWENVYMSTGNDDKLQGYSHYEIEGPPLRQEGIETIPILWENFKDMFQTAYLEKLPEIVVERLKVVVAQNREIVPPTQWKKDPFQAITSGNLRGRDLISLCNTSREVNRMCNADDQQLFKNHLLNEFAVDWSRNRHGFISPRELYKQMHTIYEYMTISAGVPHDYGKVRNGTDIPKLTPGTSIAIFVPNEKMVEYNANLMVAVFPQAPELSYYISGKMANTGPPDYDDWVDKLQTFEDEGVKARISKSDLNAFSYDIFVLLHDQQPEASVSDPIKQAEKLLDHQQLKILKKILPNFEKPKLILMWSEYRGH